MNAEFYKDACAIVDGLTAEQIAQGLAEHGIRAAPVAAQLNAELPPLPRSIADMRTGGLTVEPGYTAEQYRQGQRDAIAADRAHRAAQLDAELPPHYGLFNVNGPDGHRIKGWTAEQVQSIVAPYAERIRLLEEKLKVSERIAVRLSLESEERRAQTAQSIDAPELRNDVRQLTMALAAGKWPDMLTSDPDAVKLEDRIRKLICRDIDGRTAGTATDAVRTDWHKADLPWSDYPEGTKARDSWCSSGFWTKTERGWKWHLGSTFPTPGGADEVLLAAAPSPQGNTND